MDDHAEPTHRSFRCTCGAWVHVQGDAESVVTVLDALRRRHADHYVEPPLQLPEDWPLDL